MNACLSALVLAAIFAAQVPPPSSSARAAEPLRQERRTLLAGEAARLEALAGRLVAAGETEGAAEVRRVIPPESAADGSERLDVLPEVAPARPSTAVAAEKGGPPWRGDLETIRQETAKALFDLAARAAGTEPRHFALADVCLRGVVERQRDHAEARRLLGQVPHNGGWATPFAVSQFKARMIPHPVFGWVKASWVPHLVRGELPAPSTSSDAPERWLSASAADALRRDFARGWRIHTEHFSVQTNVPLSEAIAFGRHLEILHDVFESLFADVLAERSSLAQRFRDKTMVGERPADPHLVSYFSSRKGYADAVRVFVDVDAKKSLGYYHPPQGPGVQRGRAYFFRDPTGVLDATATLYHEGSHMLLFESGATIQGAPESNGGNYWVFEGLGTYFETLQVDKAGAVRIGGLVGARNIEARKRLLEPRGLTPLETFVAFDQAAFNKKSTVFRNYQEASSLATYLMHGELERYREGFLDYVKDACQGNLRDGSGRTLDVRLDVTFETLQAGFLDYLAKTGR
jgi:Protein of unknown function (DUF1570)